MLYCRPTKHARLVAEILENRTLFDALELIDVAIPPALQAVTRVDAQLLSLAEPPGPRQPGVPDALDPELLLTDALGRLGVRITARDPKTLLPHLQAIGFEPLATSGSAHLIEGFLPRSSVLLAQPLSSVGLLGLMPLFAPVSAAGLANSQGDQVLESDRVRATLPAGYTGSGVTVGIISDSYNRLGGASAGVAAGELPAGVNVLNEGPSGSSDEGRAMAEIVHDVAPGAGIAFDSGFFGQARFAQTIRDLANPALGGARIITDDVFYYEEPMFQDGLIAQAIDAVSAHGVAYFALAGNLGSQAYMSDFRAGSDTVYGNTFFDFDPGAGVDSRQRMTIAPGQQVAINLQWDDPWYTTSGVDGNLNLFLLAGDTVLAASTRDNLLTQEPSELIVYTNTTGAPQSVDLAITLDGGAAPSQLKWVNYGANSYGAVTVNEFATHSPTIVPHAAARGAASVGAVPYYNQDTVASYSSLGPATLLFNGNGTRKAFAEVRQAPTIVAVDGVDTSFFGSDSDGSGRPNFYGTSAAAPHAAAVAALLKQASPALTPAQVYSRLETSATDIGAAGIDPRAGYGRISAYRAIFGLAVPAALPFADGFESGVLGRAWTSGGSGAGRRLVTAAHGPASGGRHLTLDASLEGQSGRSEATLHLDTLGADGAVILSFDQREFSDEDHPMPATFAGAGNFDGVAMSVDGVNWHRLVSLTGGSSINAYQPFRFDLSAVAAANGLVLGADVRVRFQQYDNGTIGSDGIALDNVRVDIAGVTVSPTDGLLTTEAGGTDLFSVVLKSRPSHDVVIPIDSSDTGEGTISASSLTFTPANWNQPQQVMVTGQADDEVDGDQPYTIFVGSAVSLDSAYHGVNPADVAVTNRETAVPPPPPEPVSNDLKVSFQPAGAPAVAGYMVDSGQLFAARNGQNYGWTADQSDAVIDRDLIANQLLDTHLQVKKGGRWEVAVPNGEYRVTVGVGDAGAASSNNVWIEGVNLFDYVALPAGQFLARSQTVTVTDGRLLLGIGSQAGGLTRLNYVEVSPAASPPASPPPASPPPTSSPPASPPPPPAGATVKVNFQPAAAPGAEGYLMDGGNLYGSRNGQTYGWSIDHSGAAIDRNATTDQRYDTHIQVKPSGRWELAVPDGIYSVTVVVGDASAASQNNVWIEGTNAFNYTSLDAGKFLSKSLVVSINDGRLTLGIGSQATSLTRVCFIEVTAGSAIQPLPPPLAPSAVKVSFQPPSSPTAAGYLSDTGLTYGSRSEHLYGWSADHSDVVFDRQVNDDQRLDTVVRVKQGGRWELGVSNGSYAVTVTVGDAAQSTTNNVWIEGVNLFNYVDLAPNAFVTRSVNVTVSDGRLLLGIGAAASGMTGINSIEVTKI